VIDIVLDHGLNVGLLELVILLEFSLVTPSQTTQEVIVLVVDPLVSLLINKINNSILHIFLHSINYGIAAFLYYFKDLIRVLELLVSPLLFNLLSTYIDLLHDINDVHLLNFD
jgi:hypothetical protein